MSSVTPPIKEYYEYSTGAYELKSSTTFPEKQPFATTETPLRSIAGPIPRKELSKLVENIDLNSPTWEDEMKSVLADNQFVVTGINSQAEQNPEMGISKKTYIQTYFNWKTATVVAASIALFLAPAIIANNFPSAAEKLKLAPIPEDQDVATYSAYAWMDGAVKVGEKVKKVTDKVPSYISAPVISYVGYKGLESFVEKVIQFPACDYKTWTALNMQKFLEQVYPKMIPVQYLQDKVLNETINTEGKPIRSPFIIDKDEEIGKVYEEHVIKNILNNQKKLKGKIFCPIDGKTEIQFTDLKRDEARSDRIELRLLLLDAHEYKKARQPVKKAIAPVEMQNQNDGKLEVQSTDLSKSGQK